MLVTFSFLPPPPPSLPPLPPPKSPPRRPPAFPLMPAPPAPISARIGDFPSPRAFAPVIAAIRPGPPPVSAYSVSLSVRPPTFSPRAISPHSLSASTRSPSCALRRSAASSCAPSRCASSRTWSSDTAAMVHLRVRRMGDWAGAGRLTGLRGGLIAAAAGRAGRAAPRAVPGALAFRFPPRASRIPGRFGLALVIFLVEVLVRRPPPRPALAVAGRLPHRVSTVTKLVAQRLYPPAHHGHRRALAGVQQVAAYLVAEVAEVR